MGNSNLFRTGFFLPFVFLILLSGSLSAQTIQVATLSTIPILDGSDDEWQGIEPTVIPLKKSGANVSVDISSVTIKAGVFGDEIFLFIQWQDASKDDQHKPFVWDAAKKKYVAGPQREDRLALQFAISGDYTTNWISGKSFEADMWHWKAARSNPIGLMHDKRTIIGTAPQKKAYKATSAQGTTIYIQRPSDKGDKLYTTKRYSSKEMDTMPKYILTQDPKGSVADIRCSGVWKDGKWNLEIKRKLSTGNADDVIFAPGKTVEAGIAVFNHSGDDNHVISDNFVFQF